MTKRDKQLPEIGDVFRVIKENDPIPLCTLPQNKECATCIVSFGNYGLLVRVINNRYGTGLAVEYADKQLLREGSWSTWPLRFEQLYEQGDAEAKQKLDITKFLSLLCPKFVGDDRDD